MWRGGLLPILFELSFFGMGWQVYLFAGSLVGAASSPQIRSIFVHDTNIIATLPILGWGGSNLIADYVRLAILSYVLIWMEDAITSRMLDYVKAVETNANAKRSFTDSEPVNRSDWLLVRIILVFFPEAKVQPLSFKQAAKASIPRDSSYLDALQRTVSSKIESGIQLISFHRGLESCKTPILILLVRVSSKVIILCISIISVLNIDSRLETFLHQSLTSAILIRVLAPLTSGTGIIVEEVVCAISPRSTIASSLRVMGSVVQGTLVLTTIVCVLSAFGFDMSGAFTGLGLGGIATAFAAQRTLNEIFATVSLLAQRPFQNGDRIRFKGTEAIVEEVGFRGTRFRTIYSGESMLVPNTELVSSTIYNRSDMPSRRVKCQFRVTYETQVLPKIVGWIETAVEKAPLAEFVYAHLMDLTIEGAMFEYVFFIPGNNAKEYKDAQHAINMDLITVLSYHNVKFFTRTNNM